MSDPDEVRLSDAARAMRPYLTQILGPAAPAVDERLSALLGAEYAGGDVDEALEEILSDPRLAGWVTYFLEHNEPPPSWSTGMRTYMGPPFSSAMPIATVFDCPVGNDFTYYARTKGETIPPCRNHAVALSPRGTGTGAPATGT